MAPEPQRQADASDRGVGLEAHRVVAHRLLQPRVAGVGARQGQVHNACAAVVDVSLAMLRRGGWTCQMCKWIELSPRNRRLGAVTQWWPVARQEQLLQAAGMRSLLPLGDADGDEPVNYECLDCGGAAADSLFGISEGLRLPWLPCAHCNAARFTPTTEKLASRCRAAGTARSPRTAE